MPYDPSSFDEDQADLDVPGGGRKRRFSEFDCPECNANNPCDDALGDGDEVLCNYCGEEFKAQVNDDGRLRLRPT
jgi:hypothetical protein